jgi:hypothetical protein
MGAKTVLPPDTSRRYPTPPVAFECTNYINTESSLNNRTNIVFPDSVNLSDNVSWAKEVWLWSYVKSVRPHHIHTLQWHTHMSTPYTYITMTYTHVIIQEVFTHIPEVEVKASRLSNVLVFLSADSVSHLADTMLITIFCRLLSVIMTFWS